MKNCPRRQRNLMPTRNTLPASLVRQFIGTLLSALRTHEAIRPRHAAKYWWQASSLANFI
jgi:hypothetical protein